MRLTFLLHASAAIVLSAACSTRGPVTYQGYVEGEFVHVASGTGGRLHRVFVQRGQTIAVDAPLFQFESQPETAAVRQADETLAMANAQLADPERVIRAQRDQAVTAEQHSASQLELVAAQFDAGGIPRAQVEESRTRHELDVPRVAQPFFRGDQLKAEQRAAVAAFDQAHAPYREVVVAGLQNVPTSSSPSMGTPGRSTSEGKRRTSRRRRTRLPPSV
jgi:HlyD family secretion protein